MRSLVLAITFAAVLVSAQVPFPSRPDGYQIGGSAASPIQLEGFFDILCPDSAASWPIVKQVIQHYNGAVNFWYHVFPLPYHTNSFIANQGILVAAAHNKSSTFQYIDTMYAAQAQFWNDATADMTINQVIAAMAKSVSNVMDASIFTKGVSDSSLNWNTRVSWKYGCSRAVAGTPTYLLNGVTVNANPRSLADWQQIIDPMLSISPKRVVDDVCPVYKPVRCVSGGCAKSVSSCPEYRSDSADPPTCPAGQPLCQYLPGKYECCYKGEACIPNVGCRC